MRKKYSTAVLAITAATLMTLIKGLTNMNCGWLFVVAYLWMGLIITETLVKQFKHWRWKKMGATLSHLGLLLVLTSAFIGQNYIKRVKIYCAEGQTTWQALDDSNRVMMMPFGIKLNRFELEEYLPEHTPQQYRSHLTITSENNPDRQEAIEVNHPCKVDGWLLYQYSYETIGNGKFLSVFEAISDPWLSAVYVGIFLLMAGALLMLFNMKGETWQHWLPTIAIVGFGIATFSMETLQQEHLMPALQSRWFAPHIAAYIVAYTMLGVATAIAIVLMLRKSPTLRQLYITDNLVNAGLALMTLGMLMGALWAKEAWGHYWNWDPKETWAATTWLGYLMYIHLRIGKSGNPKWACLLLIFCFILLQMCWWGINYLPTAQATSLHTYNL